LKGNFEKATAKFTGIDQYWHILSAAIYYLTHRSFRRMFADRIMNWQKSYEANLAKWQATHESRRLRIKEESDEWIKDCYRKVAEI
jgi:hypothetical protein